MATWQGGPPSIPRGPHSSPDSTVGSHAHLSCAHAPSSTEGTAGATGASSRGLQSLLWLGAPLLLILAVRSPAWIRRQGYYEYV